MDAFLINMVRRRSVRNMIPRYWKPVPYEVLAGKARGKTEYIQENHFRQLPSEL